MKVCDGNQQAKLGCFQKYPGPWMEYSFIHSKDGLLGILILEESQKNTPKGGHFPFPVNSHYTALKSGEIDVI